jgi:hypothetical protein
MPVYSLIKGLTALISSNAIKSAARKKKNDSARVLRRMANRVAPITFIIPVCLIFSCHWDAEILIKFISAIIITSEATSKRI